MQRKIILNTKYKLHSIPIIKMKSSVLYSIPCGCISALLLIGSITILPDLFYGSFSAHAATETVGDSTASMKLDTGDIEVAVAPGGTGYASKDIQLSINNVEDYTLTITAPAQLSEQNTAASKAASWGYAYGQNGDLDAMIYTNFTGSTQTLESGNTNTTSNKKLALAASFANTNSYGHYKANVTLALTATPKTAVTYTLSYDANGGSNAPSQQSVSNYNTSHTFTISSSKPTRSGYEFQGWATTSAGNVAYQPNGTITLQNTAPTQKLWAVWKQLTTIYNVSSMQDLTPTICTNSAIGNSKTLTDTRDGQSYRVTKLPDGNCWMTQNINYASGRDAYDSAYGGYYSHANAANACNITNWNLPSKSVYLHLANKAGSSSVLRSNPYYFQLGGYRDSNDNKMKEQDQAGYYWSSSSNSTDYGNYLGFTSSNIENPIGYLHKSLGFSVRCYVKGS